MSSQVLNDIRENGYSRVPICEGGNINKIIAFLLTKSLIGLDTSQNRTLRQLYQDKRVQVKIPLYLHRESNLGKMIKSFQAGHAHMAIVCQTPHAASDLRDYADALNQKYLAKPM